MLIKLTQLSELNKQSLYFCQVNYLSNTSREQRIKQSNCQHKFMLIKLSLKIDTETISTKDYLTFNSLNLNLKLIARFNLGVFNNYEIRQLTIDDKEQLIKLTAESYFNDSRLQKVLDFNYLDCLQMALNLDLEHIMKTGFNFGAFHNNRLVSPIISFDYSNAGTPQKVEPNQNLEMFFELVKHLRSEFNNNNFHLENGYWLEIFRRIQIMRKETNKDAIRIMSQKWKEHTFKYAHLGSIHIASKILLFSLSSQQFIYSKADKLNGQPFYFEIIGIKLEYVQSNELRKNIFN